MYGFWYGYVLLYVILFVLKMYEIVSDVRVVVVNLFVLFIMEMIWGILYMKINKNCCCLFFNWILVKINNNGLGIYL